MKKSYLSVVLCIALVLSTLTSCDAIKNNLNLAGTNNNAAAQETVKAEASPYYSVTNTYVNHEKTFCYELDVRIPIIKYSNEESDALIDPINQEIYATVMSLVDKSTTDAYDTYETFLESARANFIADREKKLNDLKVKYKSVIGSDEVKALANLLSEKVDIPATDSEVEGFATTQDIIGDGPHKKNIIMPSETNKSFIAQTTMAIEGRPGKPKMGNIAPPEGFNPPEGMKETNNNKNTKTFATKSEVKELPEKKEIPDMKFPPVGQFGKRASLSEFKPMDVFRRPPKSTDSEIEEFVDITVENFYKELARIEHTRIPGRRELSRQFLPTYICYDFDVMCLDDEYLSLVINMSESRVNEKVRRLYYNIDLKNKKIVTLKDLKGEDYTGDENTFFINNNHEPIVLLDKYAITE